MTSEQKNILLGAILGFSLSIITQLITSISKWIYKKNKVSRFRKLIFDTYIREVKNGLMHSDDENIEELMKCASDSYSKLDYLLKNELTYLNTDWQFEAIRICEFAKTKVSQVREQLEVYTFKNTEKSDNDPDIKFNKEKSLLIIADYEKRVKSYYKLKSEKTIF